MGSIFPQVALVAVISVVLSSRGARAEDAPFILHGFFGPFDASEASLTETTHGHARWLKSGDEYAGWTLRAIDRSRNSVLLNSGTSRLELRLAGETPPVPRLDIMKETVAFRRVISVLRRNRASLDKYNAVGLAATKEAALKLKAAHPDWFESGSGELKSEYSNNPVVIAAGIDAYLGRLAESTDPDIVLYRDAEIAQMQAETELPADKEVKSAYETLQANPDDRSANDTVNTHRRKVHAEADRLYLERGGTTSLDDLPPEPPPVKNEEEEIHRERSRIK